MVYTGLRVAYLNVSRCYLYSVRNLWPVFILSVGILVTAVQLLSCK